MENVNEGNKKNMKIVKWVIIILVVILLIVVAIAWNRSNIMSDLAKKAEETMKLDNYHFTKYTYSGSDTSAFDFYKKGEKYLASMTSFKDGKILIEYFDGSKTTVYSVKNKEILENSGPVISMLANTEFLYSTTWEQNLKNAFVMGIENKKCNGTECYYITNYETSNMLANENDDGISAYIDKETGLPVRVFGGTIKSKRGTVDEISDYVIEFNTVIDKDFEIPDVSQYRVVE